MTTFDLRTLRLRPGDERTVEREVELHPLELGGVAYALVPSTVPVSLDVTQTLSGRLLRLRFEVRLDGPCMRCLGDAALPLRIDAQEYDDGGAAAREGLEASTAYVDDDEVDLSQWALDEVALALPEQILCKPGCAGICPHCGKDLNAEPHTHEEAVADPRWGALESLREQLG